MVIGKIKPTATIVAQFAAGVEIEAIQHEGKMFLPVVGMGEFASHEPAPTEPKGGKSAPAETKSAPKAAEKAEEKSTTKTYTEEELMEMDTKVLVKLLKDEYGINPDDHEGKNTNKKLRLLILEAQEGDAEEEEEDETEEAAEEAEETLADQVATILEDFDAGKKNRKKTIAAIVALADDADEDKVGDLITEFEDDADADIDEVAQSIADVLEGKKKSKKTEKKSKKSKKDEDLVEVEDLKVGDRVSVWWDDDNQEWYDGEVESIKKGKVVIAYDDDTTEAIDPEVHTKIKRLAD